MSDIYKYFGFIFSFYTNEHEPIHVHVFHDNRETIFDLIILNKELVAIKTRDRGEPLSGKDEKTARLFIEKYWQGIVGKWIKRFIYNEQIRCTVIKTKL